MDSLEVQRKIVQVLPDTGYMLFEREDAER